MRKGLQIQQLQQQVKDLTTRAVRAEVALDQSKIRHMADVTDLESRLAFGRDNVSKALDVLEAHETALSDHGAFVISTAKQIRDLGQMLATVSGFKPNTAPAHLLNAMGTLALDLERNSEAFAEECKADFRG